MNRQAANRYTQALFDLANDEKKLEAVSDDLKAVSGLLSQSEELMSFIADPVIPPVHQQEVIEKIFKGKLNELTVRFFLFLAQKERLNILPVICDCFEDKFREHNNILKVHVFSAVELNKSQVSSITQHLKLKLRKEIHPICEVDASMIGGIKIKVKDTIYDFSVTNQLERFKDSLCQSI